MPGDGASNATARSVLIGDARVFTKRPRSHAQHNALYTLDVDEEKSPSTTASREPIVNGPGTAKRWQRYAPATKWPSRSSTGSCQKHMRGFVRRLRSPAIVLEVGPSLSVLR